MQEYLPTHQTIPPTKNQPFFRGVGTPLPGCPGGGRYCGHPRPGVPTNNHRRGRCPHRPAGGCRHPPLRRIQQAPIERKSVPQGEGRRCGKGCRGAPCVLPHLGTENPSPTKKSAPRFEERIHYWEILALDSSLTCYPQKGEITLCTKYRFFLRQKEESFVLCIPRKVDWGNGSRDTVFRRYL